MPLAFLCPGCGSPHTRRGRCARCRREAERRRGSRQQRGYTDAWLKLVASAIAAHPYCAECDSTADLTGDHIVPLSAGGKSEASNLRVVCRSCNSRKGGKLSHVFTRQSAEVVECLIG